MTATTIVNPSIRFNVYTHALVRRYFNSRNSRGLNNRTKLKAIINHLSPSNKIFPDMTNTKSGHTFVNLIHERQCIRSTACINTQREFF